MTDLYLPYEAPKLQSMGWVVGPIEHRTNSASGDCAGVDAEITVAVTVDMNVAISTGDALVPTLAYTPDFQFTMLPAACTGAGLACSETVSKTETMNLANGSGGAALTPILTVLLPVSISDDFNRANNTSTLGSNWTNGSGTYTVGISSNTAATYNTPNWAPAYYNTGLNFPTGDRVVSAVLGTLLGSTAANDYMALVIGANTTGECLVAQFNPAAGGSGSGSLTLYTMSNWSLGSQVTRSTVTGLTMTTGTGVSVKRIGNVYTAQIGGTDVSGSSWTDSSNVLTRDSSHNRSGLMVRSVDGSTERCIDSWASQDL